MALTFSAQVKAFAELSKKKVELVVKQSAQDVFELATATQPGVKFTGGSFEIGKVPRDIGDLINSFRIGLNGGEGGNAGAVDLVVAGMELGDSVTGVFTSDHALPMEYGFTAANGRHVPGRFYVLTAAQQWQALVSANVAKARAL